DTGSGYISSIYRNNGTGSFAEINGENLTEVVSSSIGFGDIDNDGDLDLILTGYTGSERISKIYQNKEITSNLPPDIPGNLTSTDIGGYWNLSWDIPADDYTSADMIQYWVAISTCISGTFGYTSDAINLPRGQANVGNVFVTKDHCIQTKIPTSKSLYWTVAAIDTSFKNSSFSTEQLVEATTDSDSPGQVIDLAVLGSSYNYVTLEWTAPGDDGYSCWPAAGYDIRYSNSPINEGNWNSCTQVESEPAPGNGGSNQVFTVQDLSSGTTYYFGLKTKDEFNQWSDLSNIVSAFTGTIYGNGSQTISYTPNDGYHITDWVVNVRLFNAGAVTATNVTAEIVDVTDWVIINDATAAYPDINAGAEAWSGEPQPFMFDLTNRPPATNYIMVWLNISYTNTGKSKYSETISLKLEIPGKDSSVPKNLLAVSKGSFIKLKWNEVSEVNGYNVYRLRNGNWKKINDEIVTDNSFNDYNVLDGIEYSYKVTSVIAEKESGYSAVAKAVFEKNYTTLDEVISYPNPAKDKVTFEKLPNGSKIEIYTMTGELIYEITCKSNHEEWYLINKAGKQIGNGIYFYVIKHNSEIKTGKLAIVK
ncbi:MAG: T9SS type A sorting domain-containing protein, partial [bacterium]|nr:T9SS type A sorting domain-containing protein [bacterium]